MLAARFCCGRPPVIDHDLDPEMDKRVFRVKCLVCGRSESHRDRESAVRNFNNGEKKIVAASDIAREVREFKVRSL